MRGSNRLACLYAYATHHALGLVWMKWRFLACSKIDGVDKIFGKWHCQSSSNKVKQLTLFMKLNLRFSDYLGQSTLELVKFLCF